MEATYFRDSVYLYCLAFSASETSGYRTIDHNRDVGGTPGGPHTYGVGADLVYDGNRPGPEADTWLAERGIRRWHEHDHDHLQPANWINTIP